MHLKDATRPRPTVMAIYCPLWHRHDHMDSWKGEGWNEWELVKSAKPRFPGHYQPIRPSWGLFDESDPKWAAKEIDLAADNGIDVFLVDWYWYSGAKIMEEALERGFLRAPNRKRLKFTLMWANHDWADYFPAPPTTSAEWNQWLPSRHSPGDLLRAMDYCAEHYFSQPNYWKVDGSLFYSIFDAERFVSHLGGPAKTKRLLKKIDQRLHARGLPSIHWNVMTYNAKLLPKYEAAGFHSATSYNVNSPGESVNVNSAIQKSNAKKGIIRYEDIISAHHRNWDTFSRSKLDYFPVVTLGWDCTPRCQTDVAWPFPSTSHYPYAPVVTGNTPKRFEQLCRDAVQHLGKTKTATNVVMINAWNEWTEGCYLLPEKRYGDGYLRALRNVFGVAEPKGKGKKKSGV